MVNVKYKFNYNFIGKIMKRISLLIAGLTMTSFSAMAQDIPAGNAENGLRVFNQQCRACHVVNDTGRNGVGPNLYKVFERKAGSIENFRYSAAMRAKAEGGLVWTEANLRAYLANPKDVVPGGSMSYAGFKDNQQGISDVIAHLKAASGQ